MIMLPHLVVNVATDPQSHIGACIKALALFDALQGTNLRVSSFNADIITHIINTVIRPMLLVKNKSTYSVIKIPCTEDVYNLIVIIRMLFK